MKRINWLRVFLCGVLAGVVWIILGSMVTALLAKDFAALPNNRLGTPTPGFVLFNVAIDLVEGISILWLYAAMIAAFAWWFIVSLGGATWSSFGFFPAYTVIPLIVGTLPVLMIATVAGARFYRD